MFSQARESSALRETLNAERESASAELEALRAIIQKLESQKQEKPPPCPVISDKEIDERRRAEEKAAQEIHRLTQVSAFPLLHHPINNYQFSKIVALIVPQELQELQKEKDSVYSEKEDLSARLLEQEKTQEGGLRLHQQPDIFASGFFVVFSITRAIFVSPVRVQSVCSRLC